MKKIKFILLLVLASKITFCQFSIYKNGYFAAKEYSKEVSPYKAKIFLVEAVLGVTTTPVEFKIDPLAAANSGELTTLVYRSVERNKEGLILGFWGSRFTDAGIQYNSYEFKDIPIDKALELIGLLNKNTKDNSDFLDKDSDNHNFYFSYDDLTLLIYNASMSTRIRIYWKGFDSEMDWPTYKKMERRLRKRFK